MTEQSFRLNPFPAPDIPAISLTGRLSLDNQILMLQYSLSGNTDDVLLPQAASTPGRKDELWKATCFEFFLAIRDQPGYWEFNMSPSGDWNVYCMDAYRRVGFREEIAVSELFFAFRRESDGLALDVSVDLAPLAAPGDELQIGITAIIQTAAGDETYWALVHPGPHADFHLRDSFILQLAAQTHLSGESGRDG